MPVEHRGDAWGVRLQIAGKKIRRSLGKGSTKEDAIAMEQRLLREAALNKVTPSSEQVGTPQSRRTCLYRHWAENGRLLYVGISLSEMRRLSEHARRARWVESVVRVTMEWFAERGLAKEAEREAIERERPLFNLAFVDPARRCYDMKLAQTIAETERLRHELATEKEKRAELELELEEYRRRERARLGELGQFSGNYGVINGGLESAVVWSPQSENAGPKWRNW